MDMTHRRRSKHNDFTCMGGVRPIIVENKRYPRCTLERREQQMETIKLARARTLASLAAMLLGSVAWSGAVVAQDVSNPTAGAANASTAATTADLNANAA